MIFASSETLLESHKGSRVTAIKSRCLESRFRWCSTLYNKHCKDIADWFSIITKSNLRYYNKIDFVASNTKLFGDFKYQNYFVISLIWYCDIKMWYHKIYFLISQIEFVVSQFWFFSIKKKHQNYFVISPIGYCDIINRFFISHKKDFISWYEKLFFDKTNRICDITKLIFWH